MEMNVKTGTYFYNDESYSFNFYTNLSAVEKLRFVNSVVDTLVDDKHYNSVIRDIIFDYFTIKFLSDVDTDELDNSSTFLRDVEDFLLSTNIVEIIKVNVVPTLFDELNDAVDKSIQYLTGIHPSPIAYSVASLLNTIEKKIDEIDLESMMGIAQKFAGMTEDFTLENAINLYMNSDVHKKNLAEIEESKKQKAEFAKDMDKAIKIVSKK